MSQRVLVSGALGRMGERVRAMLQASSKLALGSALEYADHPQQGTQLEDGITLSANLDTSLSQANVVIDFSLPDASMSLLRAAAERNCPCVVGTTGFSQPQQAEIETLAKQIAIIVAPNFSVAVNVVEHLVREATRLLGSQYDAEIVELHHRAKRDAPSGTALALGHAVQRGRANEEAAFIMSREGEIGARPTGSIGIQTLRGGDCAGEHQVMFIGEGERVEISHRASTRDHFARGAVRAAEWILEQPPGLYSMAQVLGLSE